MSAETQAPAGKFPWLCTWTLSDKPATHQEGFPYCAPISDNQQRLEITGKG